MGHNKGHKGHHSTHHLININNTASQAPKQQAPKQPPVGAGAPMFRPVIHAQTPHAQHAAEVAVTRRPS